MRQACNLVGAVVVLIEERLRLSVGGCAASWKDAANLYELES